MDLSTNLLGLKLEHPVMSGAGVCKLLDGDCGLREFARSAASAVTVGSITMQARAGNSGNVYYYDERGYSVNSLGLPNPGSEYYRQHLPEMARILHAAGKYLIVNIAGFCPEDYGRLAEIALEGRADVIEVNVGCPNVLDSSGLRKRIASFDLSLIDGILKEVRKGAGSTARVSLKVSPFSDPSLLAQVAAKVSDHPVVKCVTGINTFANAYVIVENPTTKKSESAISVGLAGLAGPAIKPIGLGQVKQFRDALPAHLQIIGVGGIVNGIDVKDYLSVGANAVQITTTLLREGPQAFSRILDELTDG